MSQSTQAASRPVMHQREIESDEDAAEFGSPEGLSAIEKARPWLLFKALVDLEDTTEVRDFRGQPLYARLSYILRILFPETDICDFATCHKLRFHFSSFSFILRIFSRSILPFETSISILKFSLGLGRSIKSHAHHCRCECNNRIFKDSNSQEI